MRRTASRLVLAFCLAVPAASAIAGTPPSHSNGNPRFTPAVEVARKANGAVVNIHSERTVTSTVLDPFNNASPMQNRVNGMGTGIVLDPRGYIITNNHVIEDVQVIRIKLSDGTSYNGRVLARDPQHDLALLKIDGVNSLPTIPLGTALDLMPLEPVIAIGNAYGYEHTHTMGSVSAVKRDVALNKEMSYKGLIQTDASINPGNSGGPLLNIHGELVGVNVAIRAGAQNIGFAIPVDSMIQSAAELMSLRRRLGVGHGIVVQDQVETSKNPITRTAVVHAVESGSAAEKAGIKSGDQLISAGGQRVTCCLDLERGFLEKQAGEKVAVTVRRNGHDKTVDLTLVGVAERTVAATSPVRNDAIWKRLGIKAAPVDAGSVAAANPALRGGMQISDVDPDSPAGKAGMQRGDILIGLHQYETLSTDNISWVLTHPELESFSPLKFFLVRGGRIRQGNLTALRD